MSDKTPLDITLIRDGTSFILQTNNSAVRVRLAFMDTGGAENESPSQIIPIIQGEANEAEVDEFLDTAKAQIDRFVQSGALDTHRENVRLRAQLAAATANKAA